MITGYFKSIEVPEVAVGENVKATIDFYALNPGALYWKTFLIVDSPGMNLLKELDAAREIGQEGGRKKTYTLGKMPNKDVAISFFIFAHDDAGYDWDWEEYADWLMGFAIEVTHLASGYSFIGPGEEPPTEVAGKIIDKELEIMGKGKYSLPVDQEISQGAEVKVWVTMRNTGDVGFHPGCIWEVRDPDGELVSSYGHRAFEMVSPNETHPFYEAIETFSLLKAGNYNIEIWLQDEDDETLDYWSGRLGTVSEEEPPPNGEVSGLITRVVPSKFEVGQPIDLEIDFNAYMDDLYYQIRGWETSLQAVVDGLSDSDAQTHFGRDGSRTDEKLHLGAMPDRTLTGKLTLYGRGMAIPQQSWKVLDTKNLVITASGGEPPQECAIDADCPPGYWCLNGVCVPEEVPPPTCSIDADCPEGYVCKDGVCVKKTWWQAEWMVPALIVAAALVLVPGEKTKKGK